MESSTSADRLEAKKKIKHAAIEIAMLSKIELEYFLTIFFSELPRKRRPDFIHKVAGYQFDDDGQWTAIDKWMEGCFTRHPHYTPKRVAHMCCVCRKVSLSIEPTLILRARKIKNKLFKRRAYAILKDL